MTDGPNTYKPMSKSTSDKELDSIVSLMPTMIVMAAAAMVVKVMEDAKMAPNQLLQDPNKKPIVRQTSEVQSLEELLRKKLTASGHERSLKIFKSLQEEYLPVVLLLEGRTVDSSLLNVPKITSLVKDLYQTGLKFLAQGIEILGQLSATSTGTLGAEKKELEDNLQRYEPESSMHSLVSERLVKVSESLKLVKSYNDKMDELICQSELCRDSIREIRLELPKLVGQKPQDELDKVILELRARMDFAQRVQTEYKKQGL